MAMAVQGPGGPREGLGEGDPGMGSAWAELHSRSSSLDTLANPCGGHPRPAGQ